MYVYYTYNIQEGMYYVLPGVFVYFVKKNNEHLFNLTTYYVLLGVFMYMYFVLHTCLYTVSFQ